MGFKRLVNTKKLLALATLLLISGANMVMAQSGPLGGGQTGTNDNAGVMTGADWMGVTYYVLLFIILCFVVGVIGKILKVYDLTLKMQGKDGLNWNNILSICFLVFLVLGMSGAYWSFTEQGSMTLPEAASKHGVKIDQMFWVTTAITMPVFVITQFLLFTFAFRYRHSSKRKAYYLPHNNTIEKIWTLAPAFVLTILVVFGFFTWREITNADDVKGELKSMNVDVTGHQFAWELRYPGKDGVLGRTSYLKVGGANKLGIDFSDPNSKDDLQADTLVLPVNRPVRINIHAQDVIHSVYMPYFRMQLNAVPGLPTFFKFTPTITTNEMRTKLDNPKFEYLLYCNKICGGGHYNMQKVVRVVTEAEYQDWIAQQKPYLSGQLAKDEKMADATQLKSGANNRLALNN
jgi:cytochrome c oxidase subunit 2